MSLLKFSNVFSNNINKSIGNSSSNNEINKAMKAFVPGLRERTGKSKGAVDTAISYGLPSQTLWKMYKYNIIVRGSIDTIVREVISTNYVVTTKDYVEETEKDKEDAKEILKFFEKCNPNKQSLTDVLEEMLYDLMVLDGGAIEKGIGNDGKLKELWAVDASTIRIDATEHGLIKGYWQEVREEGRQPITYSKDDLIYFSLTPRTNSLYGLSKLETIHNLITAFLYAELHNLKFFENNTVGKGVLYLEKQIPEAQMDRFREYWRAENSGQPHKFMVISGSYGDIKWIPMQQSSKDMELINYLNWITKMIFFAFGVRPSEVGFTDDLKGAPAMGQMIQSQAFRSNTLYPLLRKIERIITRDIISKEFKNNNLQFKFIEENSLDEKMKKAQIDNILINAGLRTVDELRKEDGLGPMPQQPMQESEGEMGNEMMPPQEIMPSEVIPSESIDMQNQEMPINEDNYTTPQTGVSFKDFVERLRKQKLNTKDDTAKAFIKLVETIADKAGLIEIPHSKEEAFFKLKNHLETYLKMKDTHVLFGDKMIPKEDLKLYYDRLKHYIDLYFLGKKIKNI